MKILLATYWTLPHVGGLSAYVFQLKHELEKANHQVDLFGHHPCFHSYYAPGGTYRIEKQPLRHAVEPLVASLHEWSGLAGEHWVRETELERYSYELAAASLPLASYDLIHAQDVLSAYAFSRVRPAHVGLLSTVHGCFTKEMHFYGHIGNSASLSWQYSEQLERLGAAAGDLIIAPAEWLKQYLIQECGACETRAVRIPYGIDLAGFFGEMNRASEMPKPAGKKVIACVARLTRFKGHLDLLHTLAALKEERSDWLCWIIGDGPMEEEFQATARQLDLQEHVLFLGPRGDVPSLLNLADIFVLPSWQDNLPFAVMEAQLAGKPVVVSDVGGIPEMVENGENGILIRKGDRQELLAALKGLLEKPDWGEQLGQKAKKWGMAQWSMEGMIRETLQMYRAVIGKKTKEGSPMSESSSVKSSKRMNSLFPSWWKERDDNRLDPQVWRQIMNALPPGYTIPDPYIMKRLHEFAAKKGSL